ncbi:MAG: hypothetical protein HFG89_00615 [Dorea sp.]|jgi:hypothetical protein|nr:hypothetical protein [Dorea sp.]
MRIFNQQRNRSINFDNVDIFVEDKQIFAFGTRKIILGAYETEERASEVFEEIHMAYSGHVEVFGKDDSFGDVAIYCMPIS